MLSLVVGMLGGVPAASASAAPDRTGEADGMLPVIVSLAADFRPEGDLPPAALRNQRAGIAQARAGLRRDLRGTAHRISRTFDTVPAVAALLSPEALERIRTSAHAIAVHEDEALPPALSQTDAIVEADLARAGGFDGSGYTVAVLDTGVDSSHPLFGGRVVEQACYSNNGGSGRGISLCPDKTTSSTAAGSGEPCTGVSGCDHGTHVAGIAAASGALMGVASGADLMSVQVFTRYTRPADCGSAGAPCLLSYTSDFLKGLEQVNLLADEGREFAAVNLSLGMGRHSLHCDFPHLRAAVDNLRSRGIATVIAAGNDGHSDAVARPACISTAVTVGATTNGDAVAPYSNSHPSLVDLYAPGGGGGVAIESAVPGGGTGSKQGTSMAAPQVAGAWAVLRQRFPDASVGAIEAILQDSGELVEMSRGSGSLRHSHPRIRLAAAMSGSRVAVERTGAGRVTSQDGRIDCGRQCAATYAEGTEVTLTAAPQAGSTFAGWHDGGCAGGTTCTVRVGELTTVSAVFERVVTAGVPNDHFSSATAVEAMPFGAQQDTGGATRQAGEPQPSCDHSARTVWFRHTPAASGELVLDAIGSGFEPVLAVYTGSTLSGLTEVACSSGTPGERWEDIRVRIPVKAGQTYRIQAGGFDGQSGTLRVQMARTITRPGPPTAVAAVPGDRFAQVSWQAPASTGGSPISRYTVVASPGGAVATVGGSAGYAVVTGLDRDTTYTFRAVAHSEAGTSALSAASAPVTLSDPPDAPTAVSAVAGDRSAKVSWVAPVRSGGSPVTGYVVRVWPGGRAVEVDDPSATQQVVDGLVRGTTYTFRVAARSDAGLSADSEPSGEVEPQSPPSSPRSVTGEPGDAQVRMTWAVPSDDGGATLTGYTVSWDGGTGHTGLRQLGPGERTTTVEALANGRSYTFRVVARNVHGSSPPASRTATPSAPPADGPPDPAPVEPAPVEPVPVEPVPVEPVPVEPGPAEPEQPAQTEVQPGVVRLAGTNRFATAAAISRDAFSPGVPVAYVATGANYPDALAGGAAAARRGGPVLLVTRDGLPEETAAELARLRPAEIVVLGGAGAVSESVEASLRAHAPVRRLRGGDRFATAAVIAADAFPDTETVYVATGGNYPDALAGSTAAAQAGAPVLLVHGSVPDVVATELTRLRPARIAVLGGHGAVSEDVSGSLGSYLRAP